MKRRHINRPSPPLFNPPDVPIEQMWRALADDDEICARVREAIRADSSTSHYADTIAIAARGGRVIRCGEVEDLTDNDNLLAVQRMSQGLRIAR